MTALMAGISKDSYMEYLEALNSASSPKIEKAARHIFKKKIDGYCPHLLEILKVQIKKPKAWKSQRELIKAIGVTGCSEALSFLKSLIDKDFRATVLYSDLAFSIMLLENVPTMNLSFLFTSIEKGNSSQVRGACSALLYMKTIPPNDEIKKIILGISPFIENENRVTSPRTYIAALAYLWPKDQSKDFLEQCLKSNDSVLTEIAEASLQRKESRIKLI